MTAEQLMQSGKDGYYHAPTDSWYINGTGPLYPAPVVVEPIKTPAPASVEKPRANQAPEPIAAPADTIDKKKQVKTNG